MLNMILLPLIAALIGWVTNVLAIKALFRPLHPITVPIIGMKIQGLVPKRKDELAKLVGEIVETQLVGVEDILAQLDDIEIKKQVLASLVCTVDKRVKEKLPPFLPPALRVKAADFIIDLVLREVDRTISASAGDILSLLRDRIHIGRIVENRIKAFDVRELEAIIYRIARQELRHIELLGALLGFIVGLLQDVIIYYFPS